MTSSVPNGFSMSELQNMLDNAQAEPTPEPKEMGEATREEIENLVDKLLSQSLEEINDPMVHKALMVNIINNFIRWHNNMAENALNQGAGIDTVGCWHRDGGKFQAIANILFTINCGDNDWLCRE